MKKILSVILLAVMGSSLFSCARFTDSDIQTTTVYVSFDYGRINSGKITTLYNGCFIDFEYEKSDKTLIPGDSITFKHTGHMLSTMSYPGNTQLSGGVIKDVVYLYAMVSEVSQEKIIRNEEGSITLVDGAKDVKYVIVNDNFDFVPLSEYTGGVLFASYDKLSGNAGALALFAFNPRA